MSYGNFIASIGKSIPTFFKAKASSNYKVYTCLISQTLTNPPVVTVLDNEIGNIVWARAAEGLIRGQLAGAFTTGKTVVINSKGSSACQLGSHSDNVDAVLLNIMGQYTNEFKDGLSKAYVEIRVYS